MIGDPLELGATHYTIILFEITLVEGVAGSVGMKAQTSYRSSEEELNPNVFLAYTLMLYETPDIKPEAKNFYSRTPSANST